MPTSLSMPRLFAWFSRTNWCAPVLSHYSSIAVEGRWVSMPMVLPIESDTLLNCNHSVEEAYEKLCDYEQKMLRKVSRTAKRSFEATLQVFDGLPSRLCLNPMFLLPSLAVWMMFC